MQSALINQERAAASGNRNTADSARKTQPAAPGAQAEARAAGRAAPGGYVQAMGVSPRDVQFTPPLISSLAALFGLRGHKISKDALCARLGGDIPTPAACLRAARALRIQGKVLPRPAIEDISPLTLPAILLLRENRSCILLGLEEEAGGRRFARVIFPESEPETSRVDLAALAGEYTGFAVFASLEARPDKRVDDLRLIPRKRWFWDALAHYLPLYKDVALASIVVNCLALASPLFTMNVYDRVVPTNAEATLWVLAVGVGLAFILDFILRGLRSHFVDLAGRNADVVLASRLMDKVLNMRLDAKPESTGGIVNNIREFEQLREFFSSTSLLAVVDLPFLLMFLCLVAYIGGPIVLLPLAALPLMIGIGLALQLPLQRVAERGFKQNMHKNALLVEIVGGLETIKATMSGGRMRAMWEDLVDASAISTRASKRLSTLAAGSSILIVNLVSVFVIIWGVYRISEGAMTMGGLIACSILVGRAMTPLMQLATMVTQMQRSRMTLKSLNLLMDLPEENDNPDSVDFEALPASFALEKVSFAYPGAENNAVQDLNLIIRPGEKVGIIGRTGSGKSTLARLLAGLYLPARGVVAFGGVDIRQMDINGLRNRIGFLPQDNYLFYGTVRDNIALGYPQADDKLILRAAAIAGVTDFVRSHPRGFGMQVGERGMSLSGGQRQAVAMARALLRDPDVLLLDEPSSNLDTASERMLIMRLKSVMRDKTMIVLTHRLSMLEAVNRVIVMHDGRIVADGPRDAVLKALAGGPGGKKSGPPPDDTIPPAAPNPAEARKGAARVISGASSRNNENSGGVNHEAV